jgi:NAD-dependent DNA ligase
VGDTKPTKKKLEKAKELNVRIIYEKEWYQILNI